MFDSPMNYNGFPVIIVEPVKVETLVKRRWRDRIFSKPWKSHTTEISYTTAIEDGQILKTKHNMMMTQATWADVQRALKKATL